MVSEILASQALLQKPLCCRLAVPGFVHHLMFGDLQGDVFPLQCIQGCILTFAASVLYRGVFHSAEQTEGKQSPVSRETTPECMVFLCLEVLMESKRESLWEELLVASSSVVDLLLACRGFLEANALNYISNIQ